jgi:broad specificity phosphatase PhoE
MTELYLVRHGETEWSRTGKHTSVTDLPLTEHGVQQAQALRGHLDPARFQLVLSSPRTRARSTAEIAGFTGASEPVIDPDLAEWAYGEYEGRTSEEIHETVPGWTIWSGPVPGGESADAVAERLDRVVARVRESGVERAICFGHDGPGRGGTSLCTRNTRSTRETSRVRRAFTRLTCETATPRPP